MVLVVSVSRFLFNRNWELAEVMRDRQGNSGVNSALGKDWDFGWDLILNISEGVSRKVIMPDSSDYSLDNADGVSLRGFDLHDAGAWRTVMGKMTPGHVYLGSISKTSTDPRYKFLHYHVVLMLPDGKGGVWLYHATRRSHVHKMNMARTEGFNRFMSEFRGGRGDTKKILIVEAKLPELVSTSDSSPGKTDTSPRSQGMEPDEPAPASSSPPPPSSTEPSKERGQGFAEDSKTGEASSSADAKTTSSAPVQPSGPNIVINHLSGKVFTPINDLVSHIPAFSDNGKNGIRFSFQNLGQRNRNIELRLESPNGVFNFRGVVPAKAGDITVVYPNDFGRQPSGSLSQGEYLVDSKVDGVQWTANLFEVAVPREAQPKILSVKVPSVVQAGKSFTVSVEAENMGAESDYGGITVSSPNPSGLKLLSAKPGKIFSAGSTVLAVTSDKIRTRVPMAERWIELWGEKKSYDMQVQLQAGQPGTYSLYVRCALRGVNVKSNVILMDPASSQTIDQQGFPVQVYQITVR